jgi:hypothetical protein
MRALQPGTCAIALANDGWFGPVTMPPTTPSRPTVVASTAVPRQHRAEFVNGQGVVTVQHHVTTPISNANDK